MPNIRRRPWLVAQAPPMMASLYRGIEISAEWADVVHAHWLYPAGILATLAAPQRPLVVTSHGGDINRVGNRGPSRWMVDRVLERSQLVLAVSDALAERLRDLGGDPARIRFQPLGVDLDWESASPVDWPAHADQLKVAFVGSLIERKAPLTVVEAARILRDRGVETALAFCGDGPLRTQVVARCRSLGIPAILPGDVPPAAIGRWLATADLVVLPSLSEGRPVALMEAMAAGKPVVASNIAGVRELVTSDVGALVEPADVAGFASAMLRFADTALRKAAGEAGRRRIAELGLSTESVARAHITIYEELITKAAI